MTKAQKKRRIEEARRWREEQGRATSASFVIQRSVLPNEVIKGTFGLSGPRGPQVLRDVSLSALVSCGRYGSGSSRSTGKITQTTASFPLSTIWAMGVSDGAVSATTTHAAVQPRIPHRAGSHGGWKQTTRWEEGETPRECCRISKGLGPG